MTRSWLCEMLSTALIRTAECESPPELSGLASLLELEQRCEWQLNAYLQTLRGSLPALLLCNYDRSIKTARVGQTLLLTSAQLYGHQLYTGVCC